MPPISHNGPTVSHPRQQNSETTEGLTQTRAEHIFVDDSQWQSSREISAIAGIRGRILQMPSSSGSHNLDSRFEKQRALMVRNHLESRGKSDPRVLAAMARVPIGYGQTISQPYTVAMMCESLQLTGNENVLEVGTGSDYAACVLSHLAQQIHTIERISELARFAQARLSKLGICNVQVHVGDGSPGLPEAAPFDAIVMVSIVVITLSKRKLQEAQGRWLKLISGAAILLLGIVLLLRPEWLY